MPPDRKAEVTPFPHPPGLRARLDAALSDRYGIGEEIGRGGMATVYLAVVAGRNAEAATLVAQVATEGDEALPWLHSAWWQELEAR